MYDVAVVTDDFLVDWLIEYMAEARKKGYDEIVIRHDITIMVKAYADFESECQSDYWKDYYEQHMDDEE